MPRIARWWLVVYEYDVKVEHWVGKIMHRADALSRILVEELVPSSKVGVLVVILEKEGWLLTVQIQDYKAQRAV